MSESFLTAAFLSISGGLQDAYTYIYRGEVFANAQTGNIVLLSQSLVERKWSTVIHYLIPLGFFAMGIVVAEGIRQKYKNVQRIHWRQLVLLMEMLLLLVVGFLPTACNLLANAWYPLPVPCRCRPSAKSMAMHLPAPCVSAISEAAWNLCVSMERQRIKKNCTKPVIILESSECLQ